MGMKTLITTIALMLSMTAYSQTSKLTSTNPLDQYAGTYLIDNLCGVDYHFTISFAFDSVYFNGVAMAKFNGGYHLNLNNQEIVFVVFRDGMIWFTRDSAPWGTPCTVWVSNNNSETLR